MVRPPCCDLKKGPWTREEDVKTGNWTTISQKKGETSLGMKRCGKSCRVRWTNDSKPISKHESFTPEEEELIIKLHAAIGSRWAIIAQQLPGRTDNDIKNKWNTKLKKKLKEMGIDPVTHKPFSQIFADYGNIGVFCSQTTNPNDHISGNHTKMDLRKHSIFPPSKTNPNHNNNNNTQFSNYPNIDTTHSLDLLSQLQAINLVTEGVSRANSSSNYIINAGQNQMPESFSWHDFLQDPLQEQNGSGFEIQGMGGSNGEVMSRPVEVGHGASSSSSSTSNLDGSLFLEAMLDQENDDMFLNFPGLMEEPLY